jgi:DNA-binding NarL/FixJ family response regulator
VGLPAHRNAYQMKSNTSPNTPSKVLVIADQPILRYGLMRLLSDEPDIEVCGELDSSDNTSRQVESAGPHLVVISLPLNRAAHYSLIEQLKAKHPLLKVLAAVRYDDTAFAARAFTAGADGCVHLGEPVGKIVEAVRTVLRGELYVGNRMAKRMLDRIVEGKSLEVNPAEVLSHRELDIFTMIGEALTTQQIARRLGLSTRTIETHRKNVKMKLNLQNGAQLSRLAFAWVRDNQ